MRSGVILETQSPTDFCWLNRGWPETGFRLPKNVGKHTEMDVGLHVLISFPLPCGPIFRDQSIVYVDLYFFQEN